MYYHARNYSSLFYVKQLHPALLPFLFKSSLRNGLIIGSLLWINTTWQSCCCCTHWSRHRLPKTCQGPRPVQEIEEEILRLDRDHTIEAHLAVAVTNLNSRLRSQGLSSRKMWTKRDQLLSATPLPLNDQKIITDQHHQCLASNLFENNKMQAMESISPDS